MRPVSAVLATTALLVCLSIDAAATGLVDDFDSGTPWVLTASDPGIVQTANVIGGAREAEICCSDVSATFDGTSVLLTDVEPGNSNTIRFTYCAVMSCGGTRDFVAEGYTGFLVTLELLEGQSLFAESHINGVFQDSKSGGVGLHQLELDFTNLNAVAAETLSLLIQVNSQADRSPVSARISRITLVPEPNTALLVGAGLLAMSATRRRSESAV